MAETVSESDARYALDLVKRICTEAGPGLPGTPQERARAAIIQKELETHLGAENVVVEEFAFAPAGFLDTMPVIGACMLAAALLYYLTGRVAGISPWVSAVGALAFAALSILLMVCQFILSLEVFDPLLPKKKSVNVIGKLRRPGAQTIRRLLILGGHHDSALENTWLRFLGYGFFFLAVTQFIGFLVLLALAILQLAGLISGSGALVHPGALEWILLVYPIAPSIIYSMFVNRGRKNGGIVPGAVDNLSASALSVAMARFLVQNPELIPEDTEIRFVSFGSEEAGLRGSRRYVARHLDELKRLDARLLNVEMVAWPEISILTSDVNGFVKQAPEMVQSVVDAARRAGVPHRLMSASMGTGTDAAPFSRAGLKATTLFPFKYPQQLAAFYHSERDTPDKLSIEPLLNVLKLDLEWVRCNGE